MKKIIFLFSFLCIFTNCVYAPNNGGDNNWIINMHPIIKVEARKDVGGGDTESEVEWTRYTMGVFQAARAILDGGIHTYTCITTSGVQLSAEKAEEVFKGLEKRYNEREGL